MVRRKTILVIVSLFVILAMVIVISHIVNEAKNNAMMEYAKQNLEKQLNSDLSKGYISEFKIVSCEPYSDDRQYSQNVQVIYSIRLGDTWNGDAEDKTGLISLQKLSRVHEAKDGTLKEDCEEYAYFQEEEFMGRYDNPPDNTVIAGLNNSIWENSYVAEISKDAAETMSLEEITSRLFKDWIGTFQEWGDNSFIITEYKNFEIGGFTEPTEEENPASGITKAEVTYPDAVKTWTVGLWCDFKIIGAYDGGFFKKSPDDFYVCGGGGAFGNDGVWQDSSVFQNSTKGFVLTEREDCYTLETTSTCMDKVKEK